MDLTVKSSCDNPNENPGNSSNPRIRIIEKNPLLIEQVVSTILSHLDPDTTKEARLVCNIWSEEGRRHLLKNPKIYLCIPEDCLPKSQNPDLKGHELHSRSNTQEPVRLRLTSPANFQIHQQCGLIMDHVTTLDYSLPESLSLTNGTENLCSILEKLPNLKTLETTCLDLSPDHPWLRPQTTETNEEAVNLKLNRILQKLQSLVEMKLNFWLNLSTFMTYVNFGTKMGPVTSLRINSEPLLTLFESAGKGLGWEIQNLHLMIHNEIPIFIVRHFLRSLSTTLKHCRLCFFCRLAETPSPAVTSDPTEQIDPGQEEIDLDVEDLPLSPSPLISLSHIPWTMVNLTSLDVYEDHPRLEVTIWRVVAVSLQLPRLAKLVLRLSITHNFDEVMNEWTVNYPHRPIRSESLEELVIWGKTFQSSTILFSNYWPNLKILRIKLEINEDVIGPSFLAIFSQLDGLERLDMFLNDEHSVSEHGVSSHTYDGLLTGIEKDGTDTIELAGQDKLESSCFRSIRNLKCLKCLKIESMFCCQIHAWTDFCIYNGIIHLKTLQSLELTGKFISKKAIDDLKKEFGPNVNVYFYEDHES